MSKRMPVVGDIISSPEFAFGTRKYSSLPCDGSPIEVGGNSKTHIVSQSYTDEERLEHAVKTGEILPKWHDVDYGAYNESRGIAKFVVVRAEMEGGSSGGIGRFDDYPDELHVTAQQLNDQEKYDPNGEVIEFYYPRGFRSNSIGFIFFNGSLKQTFI